MLDRGTMGALALAAMLCAAASGARAFDDAAYPDLRGQWIGVRGTAGGGQPSFDPVKRWGTTQDAPLIPDYEAMFKANLIDQRDGGQGTNADRMGRQGHWRRGQGRRCRSHARERAPRSSAARC